MAEQQMSPESPFASVRELYLAERRIKDAFGVAMTAMKDELLAAIRTSDRDHDATHAAMRATGDERHKPIEDFLQNRRIDDAERRGVVKAGIFVLRGLRLVNEFRGVLLALVIAAAVVSGSVRIGVVP